MAKRVLAPHGKELISRGMAHRGLSLIGSATLLRQNGGDPYVVRYLYCQGIEVTLISALLLYNFDIYEPRLSSIGHDLERLVAECLECFKRPRSLSEATSAQLTQLNTWYSGHLLIDGNTIEYSRVLRCLKPVVKALAGSK